MAANTCSMRPPIELSSHSSAVTSSTVAAWTRPKVPKVRASKKAAGRMRLSYHASPKYLMSRGTEQVLHFLVGRLAEFEVPETDGLKIRGCLGADDLIGLGLERRAGRGRTHGHGDRDVPGPRTPDGPHGRHHRGPRRQAVIDEDHRLPLHLKRRPVPAVEHLPAPDLLGFQPDRALNVRGLDAQILHDPLIHYPHAAGRDGAHGQLFVPRHAELPYDQHVQRQPERLGRSEEETSE